MASNIQRHTPTTGQPAARSHPLVTLRDEVDRLFDNFFPTARGVFDIEPFRAFRAMGDLMPTVDMKETAERYEITAELPGMDEKDVHITVKGGVLSIAGEKKAEHTEEKADLHLSERSFGVFTRTFRLPEDVDEEGISADFDKGVLAVVLPKRAEAKPAEKTIEVKKHH